jgi:hypothetical protein
VCAVTVTDVATASPVASQTTAQFLITSSQPPYFDFELSFEAVLPPLSTVQFKVSPAADAACGGGNDAYLPLRGTGGGPSSSSSSTITSRRRATEQQQQSGLRSYFVSHSLTTPDPTHDECAAALGADGTSKPFDERVLDRARNAQYTSGDPDAWDGAWRASQS